MEDQIAYIIENEISNLIKKKARNFIGYYQTMIDIICLKTGISEDEAEMFLSDFGYIKPYDIYQELQIFKP